MAEVALYSSGSVAHGRALSQDIFSYLENLIIDGQLVPGERINEKQLAESRGVSRGPIREACRRLQEAQAGRILARNISQAQIDELQGLQDDMEAAIEADESDRFYDLNRRFHSKIMEFTGNRHLADIYDNLDRELHIWRKRALILDGNVRASSADHVRIIEELRSGNPTRLARILRDHSLAGRNRLLRTMPDRVAGVDNIWDDD
ncbi:hypothetical protein VE25_13220 [Devosia geojensis]|uniref:HTH gntR-type domain-containing protein n=1 Tax=Devosia geojensis TaxID=443610 RepID=A0A0F5FQZ2_9HYPH|nr:GntR family transcriptional regulator [Devosia geojensis]KKB11276.1 hypothetical protein VE25_13220 [Devosia geojensis]